ncbi:hypothetical protein FWK35_00039069, partial [Aphis craccivora]
MVELHSDKKQVVVKLYLAGRKK